MVRARARNGANSPRQERRLPPMTDRDRVLTVDHPPTCSRYVGALHLLCLQRLSQPPLSFSFQAFFKKCPLRNPRNKYLVCFRDTLKRGHRIITDADSDHSDVAQSEREPEIGSSLSSRRQSIRRFPSIAIIAGCATRRAAATSPTRRATQVRYL